MTDHPRKPIWLSPPDVTGTELDAVRAALDSGWLTGAGPQVDEFEAAIAEVIGVPHVVAVSSGTAALHLALRVLGVGPGDVVICPTLTYVASASPILYLGADPVFVDCDGSSWNMDPARLVEAIETTLATGRNVAAVIAVDLFGQCADYDRIEEICARFGVPMVEDAAEALGATHGSRAAGSFGVSAALSFNGNKIITASGGGALVSRDPAMIEYARRLAGHARDAASHYQHSELGYNYQLSNLVAAVGSAQLVGLAGRVEARRNIFDRYNAALGDLPGVDFMPEVSWGQSSRWLTCMTVDFGAGESRRDALRVALEAHAIEARPVWKPLHLQPLFEGRACVGGAVAQQIFESGICLPSGASLTLGDQDRVIVICREQLAAT